MKDRRTLTRASWKLVSLFSEMLEPAERDVVRGDYAESSETALQAFIGVLGLVVRRQLGLWKDWHPWLALIGIGGGVGIPLSHIFLGYHQVFYARVWGLLWGHPVNPFNFAGNLAVALDVAYMVCLSLALVLWSWMSGFVLGRFSRRTIWLTATVFYFVVYDFAFVREMRFAGATPSVSSIIADTLLPDGPTLLFVLLPVYWGAKHGLRHASLGMPRVLKVGIVLTILNIFVLWMSSLYPRFEATSSPGNPEMTTLVLLNLPGCYIVAAEIWRRKKNDESRYKAIQQ